MLAVLLVAALGSCSWEPLPAAPVGALADPPPGVARLHVQVLGTVPHDPAAFTEGLELDGRTLWEGTGLTGASQLRATDPATGAVERAVDLPSSQFGEGVTVLPDRIWQLTWKDGVVYERDPATLAVRRTLPYDREGWGMCHTATDVVTSDGGPDLVLRDPTTFAARRTVPVTLGGTPLDQLNELDCGDGRTVWANVWKTDDLVGIDLASGRVTAVVDAAALRPPSTTADPDAVLNGVTAIPGAPDEFLLTGKRWPTTFRVRFVAG
ncbi:glutaminyl-peptide cyclotransferase [Actinomycetospora sp. TBRC 11914]|nr:glutaminyl-peptide cyclotransferase [Actinomycetospora sp. TBRC 11914]